MGPPPNGLAFRCRERARASLQKATDRARAAVNCNAGLGGALVKYGIPIGKNDLLSGTEPRSFLVAQRGGYKAGACAQRWLCPLRCAFEMLTALLAGTKGAFRIGALPVIGG